MILAAIRRRAHLSPRTYHSCQQVTRLAREQLAASTGGGLDLPRVEIAADAILSAVWKYQALLL